ncbi:hypothetical protein PPL_00074 [Heterostelium album PN500]|uniref:Amino acid transporter transmembrane domain-containing protein n=1 Tax=Heterostelium pallidum (strain ATCC 26659 / Pp 5 / PN500) TaxID=670386 RepID=D3AVG4_HETP5|nr:hypothetical protein PPL_00074 [Heterostelium album PN500]EFA86287.1 hypothetical protein PPL_00074 [Heterostelium album PN500]|eukprot:XP_020438392.1 hypothetical protein PPL_00074 [Heterostelium album PN500]
MENGKAMETLNLTRYKVEAPKDTAKHDESAWKSAVDNAKAQSEHQETRVMNLQLLQRFGLQSWQKYIESKEQLLKELDAKQRDNLHQIEQININRKLDQEQILQTLQSNQNKWFELVHKNHAIETEWLLMFITPETIMVIVDNNLNENEIEDVKKEIKFTPIQAFGNTVKAFAGAGSFALPWAMEQAGIFIGSIGLVLIALLSNYTMILLLKCNIKLTEKRGPDVPPPSYADIAAFAYGRVGELALCFMNFSVTMAICIAYLILIGQNFGELCHYNQQIIIWFTMPVMVFLCFLSDMKYLSYTSIFGALSLLFAMGTIMVYGGIDYSIKPYQEYNVDYSKVPLWFGVAAFFFGSHIVVVPISHASGDARRYPKVLNYGMLFITIVNLVFAILGYLYFYFYVDPVTGVVGVPSAITQVLPKGAFANVVRVCIVLELICSYPLIFGAGMNVVESSVSVFFKHFSPFPVSDRDKDGKKLFISRNWKFYILRLLINVALAAVATTIKKFGSYTSLIGSLMLALTGFVVPPLLYIRYFPEQSRLLFVSHIAIAIFGLGATVYGTYQSIVDLINQ